MKRIAYLLLVAFSECVNFDVDASAYINAGPARMILDTLHTVAVRMDKKQPNNIDVVPFVQDFGIWQALTQYDKDQLLKIPAVVAPIVENAFRNWASLSLDDKRQLVKIPGASAQVLTVHPEVWSLLNLTEKKEVFGNTGVKEVILNNWSSISTEDQKWMVQVPDASAQILAAHQEVWDLLNLTEKEAVFENAGVKDVLSTENKIKFYKDVTKEDCFKDNWKGEEIETLLSRVSCDTPQMNGALLEPYNATSNGVYKRFSKDVIRGFYLGDQRLNEELNKELSIFTDTDFSSVIVKDTAGNEYLVENIKKSIAVGDSSVNIPLRDVIRYDIGYTVEVNAGPTADGFLLKVVGAQEQWFYSTERDLIVEKFNNSSIRDVIAQVIIDATVDHSISNINVLTENASDQVLKSVGIPKAEAEDIASAIGNAVDSTAGLEGTVVHNAISDVRSAIDSAVGEIKSDIIGGISNTMTASSSGSSATTETRVTVNIVGKTGNFNIVDGVAEKEVIADTIVQTLTNNKNDIATSIVDAIINHTNIAEAAYNKCYNILKYFPTSAYAISISEFVRNAVLTAIGEEGNVVKNAIASIDEAVAGAPSTEKSVKQIDVSIGGQTQHVVVAQAGIEDVKGSFSDQLKADVAQGLVDALGTSSGDIKVAAHDACFSSMKQADIPFSAAKAVANAIGQATLDASGVSGNAVSNAVGAIRGQTINNIHRLYLMGALSAVTDGFGIPRTEGDATAASEENPLIATGTARVIPWGVTTVTDEQKVQAAENMLKIAKTLQ